MVMAFEEFKREIVNNFRKRQAEQKLSTIEGDKAYVLVNANSRDEQVAQTSSTCLTNKTLGMTLLMKTKTSNLWSNSMTSWPDGRLRSM